MPSSLLFQPQCCRRLLPTGVWLFVVLSRWSTFKAFCTESDSIQSNCQNMQKKRSSGGKPSPMQALLQMADILQPYFVSGFRKLIEGDLRSIQKLNAIVSIFLGVCCIFLPHRFISKSSDYNHFAHEMIRLYGCVSFGIGYLVYWTRTIKDSRLMRATTETFCICYGLQALCILRAQFASPQGHSTIHWLIALVFVVFSVMYGMARLSRKLKDFDMLGEGQDYSK